MKILIVDDIPINRRLLRAQLEAEGHQVVEASDGIDAFGILESVSVDSIISDILMPRMDGYLFCHEIRRSQRHRLLPFIIYTATYTSAADEQVAMDLGADKFIRKPATAKMIMEALRQATTEERYKHDRHPVPMTDSEVMREYSERLVSKMEEKNRELENRNEALRNSEERFRKLTEELEMRVLQRTEALTKANEELEAFSYSISHDLRAPLRHILGYADLLRTHTKIPLDEESQRYLTTINKAATRMSELVDDLLSFSRLGRMEMGMTKVNLDQIVKDALQDLQSGPEERAILWKIQPLGDVRGDRSMLRQVMVNLMDNALKFSRTQPEPVIEIGTIPGDPGELVVFVRDNGVGFNMNYFDKLFGVFQRLHSQEEFEGTGIGLANVHRIIQRHGGRVWADGTLNSGATFYFSLQRDAGSK